MFETHGISTLQVRLNDVLLVHGFLPKEENNDLWHEVVFGSPLSSGNGRNFHLGVLQTQGPGDRRPPSRGQRRRPARRLHRCWSSLKTSFTDSDCRSKTVKFWKFRTIDPWFLTSLFDGEANSDILPGLSFQTCACCRLCRSVGQPFASKHRNSTDKIKTD